MKAGRGLFPFDPRLLPSRGHFLSGHSAVLLRDQECFSRLTHSVYFREIVVSSTENTSLFRASEEERIRLRWNREKSVGQIRSKFFGISLKRVGFIVFAKDILDELCFFFFGRKLKNRRQVECTYRKCLLVFLLRLQWAMSYPIKICQVITGEFVV